MATIPEDQYARLPFPAAQSVFSETALDAGTLRPGSCGWYGTEFDDDPGSFALVQDGGTLVDLVGQRIAVVYGDRTVYAYCKATAVLNAGEDLAVTRRLYAALEVLSQVPIAVEVGLLS
jgi:hypothetical protein